jgi:hypothetical protein
VTDLLTHVLVAATATTAATWRVDGLARRHVAVAAVGAVVPDAAKGYLLTGAPEVTAFGIEASWYGLQTVGASLGLAAAGTLAFAGEERPAVFGSACLGIGTHLALDLLVIRTDDTAPRYLYPFVWWHPPSADLLLSSDVWPAAVALPVALATLLYDWRRVG